MKKFLCILMAMILAVLPVVETEAAAKTYKVKFLNYYGSTYDVQYVKKGKNAKDPYSQFLLDHHLNLRFAGWNKSLKNIKKNMVIKPVYEEYITCTEFNYMINVGDTFRPTTPEKAYKKYKVTWTSSDTSVASVDSKGNITALSEGTTTIEYRAANKKEFKGDNYWNRGGHLTYRFKINLTVDNDAVSEASSYIDEYYIVQPVSSDTFPHGTVAKTAHVGDSETITITDGEDEELRCGTVYTYVDEEDGYEWDEYLDNDYIVKKCGKDDVYTYTVTFDKPGVYLISIGILDRWLGTQEGASLRVEVLE